MNDEQTRQILESTRYATISTVDEDGLPWAAPVWYVLDEQNNIYWWSPKDSQHSKNIANNSKCYITLFDSSLPEGKGVGLYIRATALEVSDEAEIKTAISLYNSTTEIFNLNLDTCTGEAPTRIYKAIPSRIWVNGEGEINGNYIDTRNEVF